MRPQRGFAGAPPPPVIRPQRGFVPPPPTIPAVHVVLPNDIDDPATPSGGNAYDRRICHGLAAAGWSVREHAVPGPWPWPDQAARAGLAEALAAVPGGAVVLLDGMVASAVPEVLAPQAGRLRLVLLVHTPFGDEAEALRAPEQAALATADAVITTSDWTRQRLQERYGLPPDRVHVAPPGVDAARPATGSPAGSRLLCVAAVIPRKGHDLLAQALARVADLPWSCECVGALESDPAFADRLRRQVSAGGLADRVRLAGPRTGPALATAYATADLLVLPSRREPYGMVVTEALARGVPVLATAADGVPEALGHAPDGSRPGILVPPGDPAALAGALRDWLGDADLRRRLRRAAIDRRRTLAGWPDTCRAVAAVLGAVTA